MKIWQEEVSTVSISACLIFFATYLITRQFPFQKLSGLVSVFIILSFLILIKPIYIKFMQMGKNLRIFSVIYVILFTLMLGYSVFLKSNNAVLAIRTYITCILIPLAYLYPVDNRILKAFIYAVLMHALVLIFLQLYMMINNSEFFNAVVREYIQSNGYGDVYTRNGMFFRIIQKGNELLPVAFMISTSFNEGKERLFKYILLIGVAISGNLASLIAVAVFCGIRIIMLKKYNKIIIRFSLVSVIVVLILHKPIFQYVKYVLELKNASSLPVRYEQIDALIRDMRNGYDMFLGTGMGNMIDVHTILRDYTNSIYFELQALYFFNQLGIIFFTLLIVINIILTYKFLRNKITILIYLCYILYAVTNPYIFNLTHILIIIALVSHKNYIVENEKRT